MITSVVELPENFEADAAEPVEQLNQNYFLTKTFGDWVTTASNKPKQSQLVDNLIFENEIYILFGTTNVGKSLFGVQLALHIAGVKNFEPFESISVPRKVMYIDFELQDFQFVKRLVGVNYSLNFQDALNNENILRAEINNEFEFTDTQLKDKSIYTEMIFNQLESTIVRNNINVVLFDNISFIADELENSKNSAPLIKKFKDLGRKHKVTFIIFGHTPKLDAKIPLSRNSLAGSSQLSNLVDGLLAIGKSAKDDKIVYLKELKQRSKDITLGTENVMKFEIIPVADTIPNIQHKFIGYEPESELLKEHSKAEKELRDKQIIELYNDGNKQRQISQMLSISLGTVNRIIKDYNSKKNVNNIEQLNTF